MTPDELRRLKVDDPKAPIRPVTRPTNEATDLQCAIGLWARSQFGERESLVADALAIAEETGEVCRAVLKLGQAQNGVSNRPETADHWLQAIRDESADLLITLFSLAENEGFDLLAETRRRFSDVRKRKATDQ